MLRERGSLFLKSKRSGETPKIKNPVVNFLLFLADTFYCMNNNLLSPKNALFESFSCLKRNRIWTGFTLLFLTKEQKSIRLDFPFFLSLSRFIGRARVRETQQNVTGHTHSLKIAFFRRCCSAVRIQ